MTTSDTTSISFKDQISRNTSSMLTLPEKCKAAILKRWNAFFHGRNVWDGHLCRDRRSAYIQTENERAYRSGTLSQEAAREYLKSLIVAAVSRSMSLTHDQAFDLIYGLFGQRPGQQASPQPQSEASQTTTTGCGDIQIGTDDQFHTDQSWSQSHSDMGGAMTEVS